MRNPFTWVAVACIGAIAVAATLDAVRSRESPLSPRASASRTTHSEPANTDPVSTTPSHPTDTTISEGRECAAECHEEWSRGVAEAAGYKVVENTGSAWVARGRGWSFYIWAVDSIAAARLTNEGFRILRRVRGIPIYTDGLRFAWRTRSTTVWIEAGPAEHSVAPRPSVLGSLVKASKTLG
jgi:hypothetical protein